MENELSSAVSTAPEVGSAAPSVGNFYHLPDPSTFQEYQEVSGWPSETADETALQSWRTDTRLLKYGSILFTAGVAGCDLGCEWADAEIKTLEAQNNKGGHTSSNAGARNLNQYSQINSGFQSIQNSSTMQSRSTAVNGYNTASGATSPQSQLWVTPSGAVVTWGGSVVAGPVSGKK